MKPNSMATRRLLSTSCWLWSRRNPRSPSMRKTSSLRRAMSSSNSRKMMTILPILFFAFPIWGLCVHLPPKQKTYKHKMHSPLFPAVPFPHRLFLFFFSPIALLYPGWVTVAVVVRLRMLADAANAAEGPSVGHQDIHSIKDAWDWYTTSLHSDQPCHRYDWVPYKRLPYRSWPVAEPVCPLCFAQGLDACVCVWLMQSVV